MLPQKLLTVIASLKASQIPISSQTPAFVTDIRTNVSYQGVVNGKIESFMNIPYGQDTGGSERFLPPKAFVPDHNTIYDATTPGPACIQIETFDPLFEPVKNQSEDCLNLRVTRPSSSKTGDLLPVMVYIYGGSFQAGHIYDPFYSPDNLVRNSIDNGSPVIHVSMNYRTGIFGFANSKLLLSKRAGNVGLRDQHLALQWVQRNIATFGGDPKRVTLFGESAGATSVALQITAFGRSRNNLFSKAITQSLSIGNGFAKSYGISNFDKIVRAADCFYSTPESRKSHECLRSLPAQKLLEITVKAGYDPGPVVDGDFVPDLPSVMFEHGHFQHVPMIVGWNENEGSLFVPSSIKTEDDLVAWLKGAATGFSDETISQALAMYPVSEFQDTIPGMSANWARASKMRRNVKMTCPALFIAQHVSSRRGSSPYLYHLNQTALGPFFADLGLPYLGVSHVADIPYVFDIVDKYKPTPSDELLAKQISGSWSRFASTGTPSGDSLNSVTGWTPAWETNERRISGNAEVRVIGGGNPGQLPLIELGSEKLIERCEFWTSEKLRGELAF